MIPGCVTGDFFSVVLPTEPCAMRSTQPPKVSTRDFSWGKGGRCVWLMTYHLCSTDTSRKFGALTYPEPLGPPWSVVGQLYFTVNIFVLKKKKAGLRLVQWFYWTRTATHNEDPAL